MVDRPKFAVFALALLTACGANRPSSRVIHVDDIPPIAPKEEKSPTEAEQSLRGQYAPEPWSDADSPIPVTSADAMWGSRTAKVTIVAFMDLECPFSARFFNGALKQARDAYGPSDIRIVFKHDPLAVHKRAKPLAVMSRAWFEQRGSDGFFAFLDAAFSNQKAIVDANDVFSLPQTLNLGALSAPPKEDFDRFAAQVDRDIALARKVGVSGTPTTYINGIAMYGTQPAHKLFGIIDQELASVNMLTHVPADRIYVERSKINFKPVTPTNPPEDTTTVWKLALGKAPIRGNKNGALVTIVEFSDFECAYCAKVQPTLEKIRAQYKDDVRFAFRHQPMPFHKRARPASTVALEALAQKGDAGFWAAHDALFDRTVPFEKLDFKDVEKQLGLNVARVEKAIADEKYDDFLDDESEQGNLFGAKGTPAFFINGRKLSGAQPLEAFTAIVDEELVRARALRAKGVPVNKLYDQLIAEGKVPTDPYAKTPEERDAGPIPKTAPSKGPKNARVTMQIFSDFQCPFCGRAEHTLKKIERRYKNLVRFVWRDMPLAMHKNARPAAMLAREAQKQKGDAGFWAMHDLLFSKQTALGRDDLETYAGEQGLDVSLVRAALDAATHEPLIAADEDAAKSAEISGTPSFLINSYFIAGAVPFSRFRSVIDLALKKK